MLPEESCIWPYPSSSPDRNIHREVHPGKKNRMISSQPHYSHSPHNFLLSQLRDLWSHEIAKPDFKGRIDVLRWLSKMTLDVIGQAGASPFPLIVKKYALPYPEVFHFRL